MKNAKWFVSFILLSCFFPIKVFAQQICQQEDPCAGKSPEEQVTCYESIKTACQDSRVTLSSQINYMTNQIRLTTLRIDGTMSKITTLTGEINDLGDEVNRLEDILNTRLMLLSRRIPESYKRASLSQFGLLLLSHNFSDFVSRVKYMNTVQAHDAALVFQVKATQNSYNEC